MNEHATHSHSRCMKSWGRWGDNWWTQWLIGHFINVLWGGVFFSRHGGSVPSCVVLIAHFYFEMTLNAFQFEWFVKVWTKPAASLLTNVESQIPVSYHSNVPYFVHIIMHLTTPNTLYRSWWFICVVYMCSCFKFKAWSGAALSVAKLRKLQALFLRKSLFFLTKFSTFVTNLRYRVLPSYRFRSSRWNYMTRQQHLENVTHDAPCVEIILCQNFEKMFDCFATKGARGDVGSLHVADFVDHFVLCSSPHSSDSRWTTSRIWIWIFVQVGKNSHTKSCTCL